MSHFVRRCVHGTVTNQCRCTSPNKSAEIVACPNWCPVGGLQPRLPPPALPPKPPTLTEDAARNELAAVRLYLGVPDGESVMAFLRRERAA